MNEDIVIPIAGMLMVIAIVLGTQIVRVYARRVERGDFRSTQSPETNQRLERIEHAIDAMAVEVERISEGQRFVTKLLSERAAERLGIPAGPSRNS